MLLYSGSPPSVGFAQLLETAIAMNGLTGIRVVLQLVFSLPGASGNAFDCVPNVGVDLRPSVCHMRFLYAVRISFTSSE